MKGSGPVGFVKMSARWSAVGGCIILITLSETACLLACSNIVGDSARFLAQNDRTANR